jgi:hypothetical protein
MRSIILSLVLVLLPVASLAGPKEELFSRYVAEVEPEIIAERLNQLYTHLPEGAYKNTARDTLKGDLIGALNAQITAAQSDITRMEQQVTENEAIITESRIDPANAAITVVEGTDLDS